MYVSYYRHTHSTHTPTHPHNHTFLETWATTVPSLEITHPWLLTTGGKGAGLSGLSRQIRVSGVPFAQLPQLPSQSMLMTRAWPFRAAVVLRSLPSVRLCVHTHEQSADTIKSLACPCALEQVVTEGGPVVLPCHVERFTWIIQNRLKPLNKANSHVCRDLPRKNRRASRVDRRREEQIEVGPFWLQLLLNNSN